jgi:hypothetical protein
MLEPVFERLLRLQHAGECSWFVVLGDRVDAGAVIRKNRVDRRRYVRRFDARESRQHGAGK